jgi:hypothetical protein
MTRENQFKKLVDPINSASDPYPILCFFIVSLLKEIKLSKDEKQDLLIDVSDVLDAVQPSKRSGFVSK